MAWFINKEKTRQEKWIRDFLEWQTYSTAKIIWDKWPILGGADMMHIAPPRPTPDEIKQILKNLCKKGILVQDPHHYHDHAYFHRERKELVWKHFWENKKRL